MRWPGRILLGSLLVVAACAGGERVEVRPSPQDQLPEPAAAAPPVFEPPPSVSLPDKDDVADALGAGGYAPGELSTIVSVVTPSRVREGVRKLYVRNSGAFMWSEGPYLTASAKRLLTILEHAADHGLRPRRIGASIPVRLRHALQWNLKLIRAVKPPSPQFLNLVRLRGLLLRELDVQLSASAIAFSQKVRPANLSGAALANLIPPPELQARWLARLLPWHPQYWRLVNAMARYRRYMRRGGFEPIQLPAEVDYLGHGGQQPTVALLRDRLRAEGFSTGVASRSKDFFDEALRDDVKAFQYSRGIRVTGLVNAATIEALNVSIGSLYNKIRSVLDVWRKSPTRTQSTFIQVNLPEFMVELYRDYKRVRRHRAVIGYAYGTSGGRTKEFHSEVDEVVINPTWTPSDTILANELLPKERANPGYLSRKGFQWFTRPDGRKGVYQAAGRKNTLGRALLRFPNKNNIYLHGATDPGQFTMAWRAVSHGCVRVLDIEALALDLLETQGLIDGQGFESQLATERTRKIKLNDPVPIHFEYAMVVVDDNDTVRFLPNVYRR